MNFLNGRCIKFPLIPMGFDLKFYPCSWEIKNILFFISLLSTACVSEITSKGSISLLRLWLWQTLSKWLRQRIENKIECWFMSFVTQRPHSHSFVRSFVDSLVTRCNITMVLAPTPNIFSNSAL